MSADLIGFCCQSSYRNRCKVCNPQSWENIKHSETSHEARPIRLLHRPRSRNRFEGDGAAHEVGLYGALKTAVAAGDGKPSPAFYVMNANPNQAAQAEDDGDTICLTCGPEVANLAAIQNATALRANQSLVTPRELVSGLIHCATKIVLAGSSKVGKTWILLFLALCVAKGIAFLNWPTRPCRVLYINLEIQSVFMKERLNVLMIHMGITAADNLDGWNLRGFSGDADALWAEILRAVEGKGYDLIIIDPIYKLMVGKSENSFVGVGRLSEARLADGPQRICWAGGFKGLHNKPIVPTFLKRLDRERERQMRRFRRAPFPYRQAHNQPASAVPPIPSHYLYSYHAQFNNCGGRELINNPVQLHEQCSSCKRLGQNIKTMVQVLLAKVVGWWICRKK